MCVEQAREREDAAALGLDPARRALHPQVGDGRVRVGDRRRVELQPAERERHGLGVVEDLGGSRVGEELARRERLSLQEKRGVRGEQEADDRERRA